MQRYFAKNKENKTRFTIMFFSVDKFEKIMYFSNKDSGINIKAVDTSVETIVIHVFINLFIS